MCNQAFTKIFSLILAFILLCCLCACGAEPSEAPAEAIAEVTAEPVSQVTADPPTEPTAETAAQTTDQPRYTDSMEPSADAAPDYILNTNTMKFHYPDCPSVDQMNQENKQPFAGIRDEAIAKGYDPCGNCHP